MEGCARWGVGSDVKTDLFAGLRRESMLARLSSLFYSFMVYMCNVVR